MTNRRRNHTGRPWGAVDRNLARWRRDQERLERERAQDRKVNRDHGRRPYRRERFVLDLEG